MSTSPSLKRVRTEETGATQSSNATNQNTNGDSIEFVLPPPPQPDDIDDMFADSPSPTTQGTRAVGNVQNVRVLPTVSAQELSDNWDDDDGFYKYRINEVISDRYRVLGSFGSGVFSNVLKAIDVTTSKPDVPDVPVAIKVIRANDVMLKAGQKEAQYLTMLNEQDPDDRKHIVRLLDQFMYRNHLCLVFEALSMNLRTLIGKFGQSVGLNIHAVQVYSQQLFMALHHLRRCNLLHADIKPDNIVVNEAKTAIKLCDFGSAFPVEEVVVAPLLQSRFYRAPEVVLGCSYDYQIDLWSVGCTIAEGIDPSAMIRLFMELKGMVSKKMLRRSQLRELYFDEDDMYLKHEIDRASGKEVVRKVRVQKPEKDFRTVLLSGASADLGDTERAHVLLLADMLDKIFTLDPTKRITALAALNHPFCRTLMR